MEKMVTGALPAAAFWRGRSVFVTGHTGFKGSWLALWLHHMGARVSGYALDPSTEPNLYTVARVAEAMDSDTRADLADLAALKRALAAAGPSVVLHLAAQPLVRASYAAPLSTLASNVLGTAHLLEAVRDVAEVEAVVVVTTDKVYENHEWVFPYRENDPLGGRDPYSASKAAAEIITASWRASFFGAGGHPARIATVRAGNVIGGGDWSAERLVPDCLRAFAADAAVQLRYPGAVRPWQHVMDPLAGYLLLAERLCAADGEALARGWNFGPGMAGDATVGDIAAQLARLWGAGRVECPPGQHPHEAGLLRLDITQACSRLGWRPRWTLARALEETVSWQRAWFEGNTDMQALTLRQIGAYTATGME